MKSKKILVTYHIPYSKKATSLLRKAEEKLGIIYSIDENENVIIEIYEKRIPQLEKIISKLLKNPIDK